MRLVRLESHGDYVVGALAAAVFYKAEWFFVFFVVESLTRNGRKILILLNLPLVFYG